jgi:integrase
LATLKPKGKRKRGKPQARIDEARQLVALATEAGDPAALAVVVALVFGLRVGEVVSLKCRDLDAGGTLLVIDGTKTNASKRAQEVPLELQPLLRQLAEGQSGNASLFRFEDKRKRAAKDPHKAAKDHVTRRLRQLCKDAGILPLVPHSLRGMHSSFSREAGQTAHAVAQALGHTSIAVQRRHYLRPGLEAEVTATKVQGLLLPVTTQPANGNRSTED